MAFFITLGVSECHHSPCTVYLVNILTQFECSGAKLHPMLFIRSLARALQVEWGESADWLMRTSRCDIHGQNRPKCPIR